MRQFVSLLALAGVSIAAPADLVVGKPYINSGAASGPLTPAVGDLVATPKGYRSLALEGFSEDLNQDGFVDPIGQAVQVVHTPVVAAPAVKAETVEVKAPVVAAYAAPVHTYATPAHTYAVAAPVAKAEAVEVKAPVVAAYTAPVAYHAAPAVVHTAPVVQHVGYKVHHQVHHVPQVTVQKHVPHHTTQHVINHAPVVGAAFTGLLPAAVAVAPQAAVAEPVEEAPAVVEA